MKFSPLEQEAVDIAVKKILNSRNNRALTEPGGSISIHFFHNTRTYKTQTHPGLQENKSICPMQPFQDGGDSSIARTGLID